jgi:hypothetical protein
MANMVKFNKLSQVTAVEWSKLRQWFVVQILQNLLNFNVNCGKIPSIQGKKGGKFPN